MAKTCPLCHSDDTHVTKTWTRQQLQANYDLYDIRVDDLVQETTDELECNNCDLVFFDAEEGTEEFYRRLMAKPWYYPHFKPEFQTTSGYITPRDSVLEVGAGTGNYCQYVRPQRYHGIEFNAEAVAEARAAGLNITNQSLRELDGKYTVVIAHQVLEHVNDTRAFVEQCINCLTPGGLLIYTVPSEEGIMGQMPNYCLNQPPHHMTKWRDSALRNLALEFGLTVVALTHDTTINAHHREILGRDYQGWGHTVTAVYRKR
jgi:2-polyprenyl-3-methyl-5-hydroxy-6-metoxy-1,4-benzoquinol methylase